MKINIVLLLITKKIVGNNIKSTHFVDKYATARFINNSDLDKKKSSSISNKSWIKIEQYKIIKLQAFGLSYFRGKSHFKDDVAQNCLVFN